MEVESEEDWELTDLKLIRKVWWMETVLRIILGVVVYSMLRARKNFYKQYNHICKKREQMIK